MFFNTTEIASLLSHIPPALLSDAAAQRLMALVRKFPMSESWTTNAAHNGVVGLEFRLSDSDQVDVAFPLTRHDGDTLIELLQDVQNDGWLADEPWRCFMDLLRWWAMGDTILGRDRLLWVEWDIEGEGTQDETPAPKAFVPIQRAFDDPPIMYGRWREAYLISLFETLTRRDTPKLMFDRLGEDVRALPRHAFLRFVGLRPSRNLPGMRLSCAGLLEDEIPRWLARLGWEGSKRLEDCMAPLLRCLSPGEGARHIGYVNVDLDTSGEPRPTIGLEFPLRVSAIRSDILEVEFLEKLVDLNIARADKVEALCRIPSATLVEDDTKSKPKYKIRRVYHVKVQLSVDGFLDAKAYAGQAFTRHELPG